METSLEEAIFSESLQRSDPAESEEFSEGGVRGK
jgi:hypothetical protein